MERLTEKIGNTNCVKGCGSNCKYGFQHCRTEDWENCKTIDDVIDKLAEYEGLEEQGLLLRLPCKVGDDIYAIPSEVNYRLNKSFGAKGLNAICRQVVDHIEFNSYGYLVSTNEGMTVHRQEAFGETWFLTRNEAEQKLKEMESD